MNMIRITIKNESTQLLKININTTNQKKKKGKSITDIFFSERWIPPLEL